MKGVYLLGMMMFIGLVLMYYSSCRMMNILEDRKIVAPSNSPQKKVQTPSIAVTDPDLQPYVAGSFVGLTIFIVGAIGGLIVIIRAFTRRL